MVEIVQKDAPVLRKSAEKVPVKEITSEQIKKIVADMKAALASQDDGVAIAAPQIGELLRIFVVSGKVTSLMEKGEEDLDKIKYPDMTFINPEIVKTSKRTIWADEGCLSVRFLYGKVKRSIKTTIRAYDEFGKITERGASGLLAQVFQHEMDHLRGVLFTDKAKEIEEIPPEKAIQNAKIPRPTGSHGLGKMQNDNVKS